MSDNRLRSRRQSGKIAFCGLMVALSITLLLSGGFIPVATYCAPMAAGILLLPILLEYGKKAAWTAFAATALLTLLMDTDKEAAFFYLFLGCYPLLKWEIERIPRKRLRLPCKLAYFNCAIFTMYAFLSIILNMEALVQEFSQMSGILLAVFLVVLNLCLLLYDRLLFPMIFLYANKIKPRLKSIR